MTGKKVLKVLIWVFGVAVALVFLGWIGIHLGFYITSLTAYPQPEYQVESYEELLEAMAAAEETYNLPAEELIQDQGFGSVYKVWLKDRFHDDPSGYIIHVYTSQDKDDWIGVDCRLVSEMEEKPVLNATQEEGGVSIQVSGIHAQFILDGCLYIVRSTDEDQRLQIIQSIVGN